MTNVKPLPKAEESIVLRTALSSEEAWQELCDELRKPVDGFTAYIFVSDAGYAELDVEAMVAAFRDDESRTFLLVADSETFSRDDRALLVVDLWHEPGRTFRVVPKAVLEVQSNLSIANMDFEEFMDAADEQGGAFRGF